MKREKNGLTACKASRSLRAYTTKSRFCMGTRNPSKNHFKINPSLFPNTQHKWSSQILFLSTLLTYHPLNLKYEPYNLHNASSVFSGRHCNATLLGARSSSCRRRRGPRHKGSKPAAWLRRRPDNQTIPHFRSVQHGCNRFHSPTSIMHMFNKNIMTIPTSLHISKISSPAT